jgi:hypothetical protein
LIFQNWIKNLHYHSTRGFVEARDQSQNRHLLLASQTPPLIPDRSDLLVSTLQQFDMAFAAHWYQLSPYDAIWMTVLPPTSHFPPTTLSHNLDAGYQQKRPHLQRTGMMTFKSHHERNWMPLAMTSSMPPVIGTGNAIQQP